MPKVTFSNRVASDPTLFLAELEDMALSGVVTRVTATKAVILLDTLKFTLTGTDFTFAKVGGTKTLTSGTLDEVQVKDGATKQLSITELGLDLSSLHAAAVKETTGVNTAAIENLLFPMGWNYRGNKAQDVLAPDATSADGVAINLAGDDYFSTKGGLFETIFLGDGNDTAFGGGKYDVIYGGSGLDILHGGPGDDQLIGGNQGDALFGEKGNDRFYGGSGDDLIVGGRGFDTMSGEQGRDTFVFHRGDGADQIQDFDLDHDTIDLPDLPYVFLPAGTSVTLIYGPGVDLGEILGKDTIILNDINPNDFSLIHIV